MKPTNFSKYLSYFFNKYLLGERNVSSNTILSYKDTFVQFITFLRDQKGIKLEKVTLETITKEVVLEFLTWIQEEKKCSNSTRNSRLAAIHSFFKFLQYENPERLFEWQKILSIKAIKNQKESFNYLSIAGIKLILEQPDINTPKGRRDLAMLALMYDCGARVQEIIDLTPSSIRFDFPNTVRIKGKGNKVRVVPLQEEQTGFLKKYMAEHNLLELNANQYPLFSNNRHSKLTRAGITYVLKEYTNRAREINPKLITNSISCHSLRHSKAMHLLQAGVNIIYIRDLLGHTSVQTTDIYARADSKQKREAFEKAYTEIKPKESASRTWEKDNNLLSWLKSLGK